MTITSIDFETANHSRVSICAAGMAVFENGILTEAPYWLVRPPTGHGWFLEDFTDCHGLTRFDVQDAPEFPAIAAEFLQRLARSDMVIAHNASFDLGHLRKTLAHFGLACPEFDYLCTCRLARRVWPELPNHKLATLTAHIGHTFQHHHAQADAEAAARVLLAMMKMPPPLLKAHQRLVTWRWATASGQGIPQPPAPRRRPLCRAARTHRSRP